MRSQISANPIRIQEWKLRSRNPRLSIDLAIRDRVFVTELTELQGSTYTISYFDEITFSKPPTKGNQITFSRPVYAPGFKQGDIKEKNKYNKTQFRQMIGRGTRSRKDFLGY